MLVGVGGTGAVGMAGGVLCELTDADLGACGLDVVEVAETDEDLESGDSGIENGDIPGMIRGGAAFEIEVEAMVFGGSSRSSTVAGLQVTEDVFSGFSVG